ncbi:hypothetical protein Tco_1497261 [Tanacetum coccineum]
MIFTGSSTKLSLSSSRSSFIGMTRDSSDMHFFRLEPWKVLWTLLRSSGSSSLYVTGPIRLRILKGLMYRGLRFTCFSNRMKPLRACKHYRICTIFLVVSWIISGLIEIDENLRFVEEPIEIVERDVKKLKRRRIPLVKVRWNSRQGAEYTWEREDQFRKKYPNLFSEPVPSSSAAT